MTDWYQQLTTNPIGRAVVDQLGIPAPVDLRRYTPGAPIVDGPVLFSVAPGGRLGEVVRRDLTAVGAAVSEELGPDTRYAGVILDATGVTTTDDLRAVYDLFHPAIRQVAASGRLIVLADFPGASDSRHATAHEALNGFIRSAGKEVRHGATANLVQVGAGAEDGLSSTLRFLLSGRSAFVSGQTVRIQAGPQLPRTPADWQRPLADEVAVVTGAAQGIGAAIAEVLARDGAHVVCLDIPPQGDALAAVANAVGGSTLQLDITADDAPHRLVEHLRARHGGADIVVHNAGITRDKTLAGMDGDRWDQVIDVNLASQERLDDALLRNGVLRKGGRIVAVSSLSGIAGNRGQANYATSKAGVIGRVRALAPHLASEHAGTINAVAPGFIETAMTGAMPFAVREAGRRMNSLNQGGLPVDVAETIAWLANPASLFVNGQVVRVCGQSLLGA